MAYQTGTASSIGDLVQKLFTFATGLGTTPWTQLELDTVTKRQGTMHRGSLYVTFRWDNTVATDLGLYQSLGWTAATDAHNMPDDSGNGDTSVPINAGRRVNFGSTGPYTAYHFFAGEGATPYIYVTVEVSSGLFRHFVMGNLKKHGTWTGGEFVGGHVWGQGATAIDVPNASGHSFLLDASSGTSEVATMHVEGLPSQGGSEKWAALSSQASGGTDRAGNARRVFAGGGRGGLWGYYLAWMRYSTPNAFKPLATIGVIEYETTPSPDVWRWMGEMPDIALVNMHGFLPGQEIVIGGDTWKVFPWVRQKFENNNTEESWNAGVAYKKVV